MLKSILTFLIFLTPLWASQFPETAVLCPDSNRVMLRFQERDFVNLFTEWQNYFQSVSKSPNKPASCELFGRKILGMMQLILKKDTVAAINEFSRLIALDPLVQMWDLDLSTPQQSFWDAARDSLGPEFSTEDAWKLKWIPPIKRDRSHDPLILALRKKFNEMRKLFALVGEQDQYQTLLTKIAGETDPAFLLLKIEIRIRMKERQKDILVEMNQFSRPDSPIVSTHHLSRWRGRVNSYLKGNKP